MQRQCVYTHLDCLQLRPALTRRVERRGQRCEDLRWEQPASNVEADHAISHCPPHCINVALLRLVTRAVVGSCPGLTDFGWPPPHEHFKILIDSSAYKSDKCRNPLEWPGWRTWKTTRRTWLNQETNIILLPAAKHCGAPDGQQRN